MGPWEGDAVIERFGWAIALSAALLAGCKLNVVAKRSSGASEQPSAIAQVDGDAKTRSAPLAKLHKKAQDPTGLRLVTADDDDLDLGELLPAADYSTLSLDDAIETALKQNADLVALRQAEGVSEAALGVAQTYPFNPWVQVRATPYQRDIFGSSGSTFHYVLLQQNLQLAHQQQFREDVACSQLNQVRWNIHNFELLNAAQTTRLYLTALYQRGIRDLTRSSAELNQQLLRISESQLEAEQITGADVAIVRIDARSTRQQADLAEANYQTALLDLRRQLNIPLDERIELAGDLTRFHWTTSRAAALKQASPQAGGMELESPDPAMRDDNELIKRLADGRPDVMAAKADTETAHSNYRLANAMRTPDLLIGPFYERDDFGTVFAGFQAQMDLPVNNTGRPLARQREAEHQQRHLTWQQLQTRAELEAVAAADRYERARRLVDAARSDFQADLPSELEQLEAQFKAGEVDVPRVFQGRTSLINNRRAALDLLNELAQATAALTAATGIPPKALVSTADGAR
jgi:outer membrane protein TolC